MQREPSQLGATIGAVYVNDVFVCWSLEDQIREVAGVPVVAWKVQDQTAIPAHRYRLVFEWSPRFATNLWELKGVEGFSEAKFHAGNKARDTDGCILLGLDRGSAEILRSQLALAAFHDAMQRAGAKELGAVVDVNNPPGLHFAPLAAPTLRA